MSKYRVVLVQPPTSPIAGQPIAELDTANVTGLSWTLNEPGLATFTMPVGNSKTSQVKLLETEVRIYRNGTPIFWGVPLRARSDAKVTEFQCPGIMWYLTKRHVGDAQRPNLLKNPSFENGDDIDGSAAPQGWIEGADSIERIQVRTTDGSQRGSKVLTLSESRDVEYTPKGATNKGTWSATTDYKKNDIVVRNGKRYLATSNPSVGNEPPGSTWKLLENVPRHSHLYQVINDLVPGERVAYAGWFRIHSFDGPSAEDRGLYQRLYVKSTGKLLREAMFKIDKDTTVGEWQRAEVSIKVPRGINRSDTLLRTSLYCPKGVISWDAMRVNRRDFLLRGETDLATAAKKLVEHAQDPAFKKTTLGFGTAGSAVGVLTNKRFPHDEHQSIYEALLELTKGSGGIDFDISPVDRTFTVYAVKGTHRADKTLELKRNIADFELIEDGEQTANSVVVLAPGEGADREEAHSRSLGAFAGMAYEAVIPTRTHLKELGRRADEHVARRNRLVKIPSVTTHPHNDNLVGVLQVGDTVPLRIRHGRVQVNETVRIYGLELDPATDTLTVRTNA